MFLRQRDCKILLSHCSLVPRPIPSYSMFQHVTLKSWGWAWGRGYNLHYYTSDNSVDQPLLVPCSKASRVVENGSSKRRPPRVELTHPLVHHSGWTHHKHGAQPKLPARNKDIIMKPSMEGEIHTKSCCIYSTRE